MSEYEYEYERRVARYYKTKLEIRQLERERAEARLKDYIESLIFGVVIPAVAVAIFIAQCLTTPLP